jgi:glycosyltransferase involved in cell wall biosynthesis
MRIAMLSWESLHSISVGGLAAHVTELADALRRRGDEVHVFTRMDAGQARYDCIDEVHYHRCPFEPHADFLTYIRRMCDSLFDRLRAAEDFYGRPFDIVHGHDWLCAQALVRAKNDLRRRAVMTVHSTEYGRCGNQLWNGTSQKIRDIEWLGTYVADRVICVSRALAEEVQRLYATPPAKSAVVYNGVNVHRFDGRRDGVATRGRIGIGPNDPLVLFVGRLAWQKGPDLLLDAVPELLRRQPSAKFAFAGDGHMRSSLEGKAASDGLFDSVRFVGHRNGEDLVDLFKAADAVCVPSRNEPFGIVVLEGWSAARPVVVTRNGGPAEIVRDQETGFTVSADRESLSWGLGTVLADRERSERIGQNGRREAELRFTWDTIAAQTTDVYESL